MLRRPTTGLWLAIAFGLTACGGGQTPDELSGGEGILNGENECEETRTPVTSLEQTVGKLGFSAAEVLAFSAKKHETMLAWLPVQRLSYGPESGDVPLSLTVRHTGGPIDLVESTPRAVDDNFLDRAVSGGGCGDALAIEVDVELTTAQGALSEQFTAELRASTAVSASIVQQVELDALGGTFEARISDGSEGANPDSAELSQPTLRITFSEVGTEGRFDALFVEYFGSAESGFATGGLVEFARWPADDR